jgi:protein-S-isoprenylcysteine O-methyltransferase Ste14
VSLYDQLTIFLVWALWFAYWIARSGGTEKTGQRESHSSRRLHLILAGAAFALIALPLSSTLPFGLKFLPSTKSLFVGGLIILICGLAFTVWARRHLGRYWSGTITLKEGHRLIRTGPYAIVRHPIYTGVVTGMVGTAVAQGQVRSILAVVLLAASYLRKIKIEETWLVQQFGDEYRSYQREVGALIPWIK